MSKSAAFLILVALSGCKKVPVAPPPALTMSTATGTMVGDTCEPSVRDAVIHPVIHISKDVPQSNEVSEFMNGIKFSCPEGYKLEDVKHLLRSRMSYKDTINGLAQTECRKYTK